jgi:hypothetical protein
MTFESAWEAFTERAAIIEFDGGVDRWSATLRAFELCFPGDFRECMWIAGKNPEGETALYEYLENLMKTGPQTHEKGPPLNEETEKVDKHVIAPDGPPMPRYEGTEALTYMTGRGISLIGAYDSGATIAGGAERAAAFTTDMNIIDALRAGTDSRAKVKITRFYFLPQAAGLLCLDIDHKNGKDGIQDFYAWAERAGKPRHLLPRFLQDLPANFPCYVQSPSRGLHLYFSYSGGKVQKRPLSQDTPGVEIKHGEPGLTSPGSYKNGNPYILHGDIENSPPLPAFILAAIEPPKPRAAAYIPKQPEKKDWGKPSWEKIRDWTEADGAGAGRNDRAFNLARHARNHGYTEAETLAAMRGDPSLDGLPEKEIETAIHSAFSRKTA